MISITCYRHYWHERYDKAGWIVRHGRYLVFQLAEVAVPRIFRRDPASDRPTARIARAGDMTEGDQMVAGVEGRGMRLSPAEPAATGCRGVWKRLRTL